MKNKKYLKVLCCGIMCLSLFVSNCFAITHKKHWWGDEYTMENHEIGDFRITIQDLLSDMETLGYTAAVTAGLVCGTVSTPIGGVTAGAVVEGIAQAQGNSLNRLITDLERWERRGKAIIVCIPNVIQGWNIKER